MKRFRNADGKLNVTFEELKSATAQEAASYYQIGAIYKNAGDDREYVYLANDDCLAHFQSFDGYNLFIPIDALGSFWPDVADDDRVLEIVND